MYPPEEILGSTHLVANNDPPLASPLDLIHLNDGPISRLHVPHDVLVNVHSILGGLLKEAGVRHKSDVGLAFSVQPLGVILWGRREGA